MKINLNQYKTLIIIATTFVILFILIYVATRNLIQSQNDLTARRDEVEQLEKKLAVLESNRNLTQSQIDNYNKLLSQLIPDQEDYFSILFALEHLATQTGFLISHYYIAISEVSPEKIVVTVEGDGDSETFLTFLKEYQFAGGRLITNESLEYTSDRIGQIRLTLNFYNKKVDVSSDAAIVELTQSQIALMNKIQSKTSFILKDEYPENLNYPVKENPF